MPELTTSFIKDRLEYMDDHSSDKVLEASKYNFHKSNTVAILQQTIDTEFRRKETQREMRLRLLPINVMKKIINKLANVYIEPAIRQVSDGNEMDQELLGMYEDSFKINTTMLEANQQFLINRKVLLEPYVDDYGFPRLRVLPAYTYWAFSESMVSPNIPDSIFKIIKWDIDPSKRAISVWTKERNVIVDGSGHLKSDIMARNNNPEGENPYGVLPFIYTVDSDLSTEPIQPDDIYTVAKSIPILLTDLSVGNKFQNFSMIYTVDYDGDLPWGPGSIIHMNRDQEGNEPKIEQIKPQTDVEATLRLIEATLSMLLTTNNLNANTINNKLTVENLASGVAKVIDNIDMAAFNKVQQEVFLDTEWKLWKLVSKYMTPVWRKNGELNGEVNREFSSTFNVNVQFQQPKMMISEKEQIEISALRIENGFSTHERELKILYPDYDDEEIERLIEEIKAEKLAFRELQTADIEGEMNGEQG